MLTLTEQAKGHIAMLGFSLGIAGSFSLGSLAANEIEPVVLTAARFAGTAPLMAVIALLSSGFRCQDADSPWRYAIPGALMALYFVLMFEGLENGDCGVDKCRLHINTCYGWDFRMVAAASGDHAENGAGADHWSRRRFVGDFQSGFERNA